MIGFFIKYAKLHWNCKKFTKSSFLQQSCKLSIYLLIVREYLCAYYWKTILLFLSHSARGLPDNIQTYGLISGLWTSTFALGAFIGPSVSGFLYDHVGFRNAVIFVIGKITGSTLYLFHRRELMFIHCIGVHSLVGLILLSFICSKSSNNNYKELGAAEPLLKDSTNGTNYTNSQTDENTDSTPIKRFWPWIMIKIP